MFESYEFTFAGKSSLMYGMMIADIGGDANEDAAFGNKAEIVEKRLPQRVRPLHYGVRYNDEPLTFSLVIVSRDFMDRYQMEAAARWLTGYDDYQWLTLGQADMAGRSYRCLIRELRPISVGWFPIAFEAQVICDSPYSYGYLFNKKVSVKGSKEYRFLNQGSARVPLRPLTVLKLDAGETGFTITNRTTGQATKLTGLPAEGLTVYMDSENQVLRDEGELYNLYDGDRFNFVFPELVSGENRLLLEGNGEVSFRGRFIYNTGA